MRQSDGSAYALPLDDRLFQESLYVTHAGWEKVTPHQPYPRPGHPSYYGFKWDEGRVLGEFCLCLLTAGKGEMQTRLGRQSIRPGQAFLYQPGEWHRHRPLPAIGWSILWINFNGNLAHRWMTDRAFRLDKNLVLIANPLLFGKQFRYFVETVEASGARNSLEFSWQAIGLLAHFLGDTISPQGLKKAQSGDSLVDSVMHYIWSHSHNQIRVSDLSRHTSVNRRMLERRMKSVTGTTVLKQIQHCRISRAELLLRETNVPIKYVIGRSGFASYQSLRQAFQKRFGLSPEGYRLSLISAEKKSLERSRQCGDPGRHLL